VLAVATLGAIVYVAGTVISRGRGRAWPVHRTLCAVAGIVAATAAVIGPPAQAAHGDLVAHMRAHLLIGMIAPVLLVLSAPATLALRTLAVTPARRLSRLLRSAPVRVVTSPVAALVLSAGGLWLLYLTPLFGLMRSDPLVHVLVQVHLLISGFVFTAAVIGTDPRPHGPRWMLRAVVLALSMASHAILAKHLYADPPAGVAVAEGRAAAELMYYAGAWVEASVVLVFCLQWYRASGASLRREAVASGQRATRGDRGHRWSASTPSWWERGWPV